MEKYNISIDYGEEGYNVIGNIFTVLKYIVINNISKRKAKITVNLAKIK
ncbi:MAG: hypothetical protein GY849_23390 [Deltaproteobacteria bacterium]|nr:hypothetical protein [Deltaproteobacteria bacterium]